ncbi:hypothetical protein AVEN_138058-1 [Araneus ventricosus]|uniref:Uncharacterized protein n=1 Tax=Araneus ventricosus TaxID=182803 RepID=A0A4Y2NH62_ARAVE|nr:hypothetical protein AVEN_138058-1 [Araneus ventricosus]
MAKRRALFVEGQNLQKKKQVVQDLRKNLEVKQSTPNSCPNSTSGFPAASHSPSPQIPNQDVRLLCPAQKCPVQNHKLPTTTIASKPVTNCVNTVRQTVPPTLNNIATPTATFTFKAPVGTVVLPNCSTALSTKVAEHQKMHPVLVVPSPSNRTADGPQTGVLLNLVPPIRVPQYPPPLPRSSAPLTCHKNQVINNCIPVAIASLPTTSSTPPSTIVEPTAASSAESPPAGSMEKLSQSPPVAEKITNKIDQKGLNTAATNPRGHSRCPGNAECQSEQISLIVVQSYDMLKAAKEDEKRKLLKKSLELRLKRSQLESRLSQLKELSTKQKSRQSELQTSLKEVETGLERIQSVINGVRLCS